MRQYWRIFAGQKLTMDNPCDDVMKLVIHVRNSHLNNETIWSTYKKKTLKCEN